MPDGERRVYRKLVRDRIPEIIAADGMRPVYRTLSEEDFLDAAIVKITEEAEELRQASPEERLGELADLWELLTTVAEAVGLMIDEVADAAAAKRTVRGGFGQRLWLEEVVE